MKCHADECKRDADPTNLTIGMANVHRYWCDGHFETVRSEQTKITGTR